MFSGSGEPEPPGTRSVSGFRAASPRRADPRSSERHAGNEGGSVEKPPAGIEPENEPLTVPICSHPNVTELSG